MRYPTLVTALLALLLPGISAAQYGYGRRGPSAATANSGPYTGPAVTFHGTVKVLTKKELIVDLDKAGPTEDQQTLTFRVSRKTKFLKDDKEIKPADFAVGMHITVDATRDGDQKLSALNVMAPDAAAKAGAN
jgi:hypothetical protein